MFINNAKQTNLGHSLLTVIVALFASSGVKMASPASENEINFK